MAKKVVAISRAMGASGEEVAQAVAKDLGYRYVDDEIISRAAQAAGVAPDVVGEVEHTRPLMARILESMAVSSAGVGGMGEYAVMSATPPSKGFEQLIQQVIRQVAEEGNVVLVAHGASIPLAGMNGLLRVLVTASPDVRAGRLDGSTQMGESKAKKAIDDSDKQRADFLKRFYNVKQELPTHYDLVLNMDTVSVGDAVKTVVALAKG
ncbi:MAG: cytidylate kinase-like family protein [Chloroflexi bacterium]|nr:cytidylate kinase-like family protein [Chloroflexota bacterium]